MVIAVVFAAGEGKRLRPLTRNRPKAMLPVGGKPLLQHLLEAIHLCGIRRVVLLVGHKKEMVESYFGDGERIGLEIAYAVQEPPLGTADALRKASALVDDDFLLVYGDLWVERGVIEKVLNEWQASGEMVLSAVRVSDARQYGLVKADQDGYLLDIEEKPTSPQPGLVNAGIYLLHKEFLRYAGEVPPSPRGEYELTQAICQYVSQGERVKVVEVDAESWVDVGRPWDLLRANELALGKQQPRVEGEVSPSASVEGGVVVEEGAKVLPGTFIQGPVYVGRGCVVGPNAYLRPHTSLCEDVRVGASCEVKNSIVMRGTHIPHLSYVGDSIIGEGCNLGAGTIVANLRLDDASVKVAVDGKRMDSGRRKFGVVIGDYVKTGIGVSFMPGVVVGCNSWIAAHTLVDRDIPEGVFAYRQVGVLEFAEK